MSSDVALVCSFPSVSIWWSFWSAHVWLSASRAPLLLISIRSYLQMGHRPEYFGLSQSYKSFSVADLHPPGYLIYVVQQVCLFLHDPRELHLAALKRILRYVRGMLHMGLLLQPSRSSDLTVYSDADWAGCPDTRRSTSGYAVFLGDNLVSWSSKWQNTVSRSSAEAEYRAVANGVAEATWLRQLLQELHVPSRRASLVYCDNISAVYMSSNPVQHQHTKHIEIDLHIVRKRVAIGAVRIMHVPTSAQYADIFTKGLPTSLF